MAAGLSVEIRVTEMPEVLAALRRELADRLLARAAREPELVAQRIVAMAAEVEVGTSWP